MADLDSASSTCSSAGAIRGKSVSALTLPLRRGNWSWSRARRCIDVPRYANSIRHPDPVPSRHRSGAHGSGGHGHAAESHSHSRARDGRPPYHHSSSGGPGAGYRDRERDRDRDRYRERERDSRAGGRTRMDEERVVDAIFSAHSDGLMVILRPSST